MKFDIIRTQSADVSADESAPQKNVYELHAVNVQTFLDNSDAGSSVAYDAQHKIVQDPVTGDVTALVSFITLTDK